MWVMTRPKGGTPNQRRFMGSLDLRRRTPIGAMNRGAPNWNSALRFMESFLLRLDMPCAHEPARLRASSVPAAQCGR